MKRSLCICTEFLYTWWIWMWAGGLQADDNKKVALQNERVSLRTHFIGFLKWPGKVRLSFHEEMTWRGWQLAHCHTTGKWQSWKLNSVHLESKSNVLSSIPMATKIMH
jgi:hypothetical protein